MIWQKEFGYHYHKNKDFLLLATFILSIFALIVNRPLLFIIVGLFGAYLLLNFLYDQYVGQGLKLKNERRTLRLFPGDEAELEFEWENESILPYVNGRFHFQMEKHVTSEAFLNHQSDQMQGFTVPLSLLGRRKTRLSLPIKARQRGVTRLRSLYLDLPHLFNFDDLRLNYHPFYATEIVVYPRLLPVEKSSQLFDLQLGEEVVQFSPYDDILSPLGTRDYMFGDPFQRINFKATAKTGRLQTNIYEKTIDQSYLFIVNLMEEYSGRQRMISPDLEDLLSYTAYLTGEATREKLAYEMVVNAHSFGKRSYVYQAKGQGQNHYLNSLDILARIHGLSVNRSFLHMLYELRQRVMSANIIIFIGEIPREAEGILSKWQSQHKRLYHVCKNDGQARVQPWTKVGEFNE